MRYVHLFEEELSLGLLEGREWAPTMKMDADVGEALFQAAKNVDDERAVRNRGPKIGELTGPLLEAPTIVSGEEIALGEAMELDVKEKRACLTVPQKLRLHCNPKIASSRATAGDGFGKVIGEGAGDPGLDHAVHASLVHGGRGAGVEQNVILKRELAGSE